jgi:DNA modification methylase
MPVEPAPRAIRLSGWPGEMALDTFAGASTTLMVACQLVQHAVDVDVSERHFDSAPPSSTELRWTSDEPHDRL